MPPKGRAAAKPNAASTPAASPLPAPSTIAEQTDQRIALTNPHLPPPNSGISSLPPAQRTVYINSRFASSPSLRSRLGTKAQRDLWRQVNDSSLPIRNLKPLPPHSKSNIWRTDKSGRDIASYTPEQFAQRTEKLARLTSLLASSLAFTSLRQRAQRGIPDPTTHEPVLLLESDLDAERTRRLEMASLKSDLYGVRSPTGTTYSSDPIWDDITPIALSEPADSLASIAYPEAYAEAISYLRAVMLAKEYSPRTLKLTEHIISLNAAHYTVWLFRASILSALQVPIPEEITWLNGVALSNLKNYQIWHHRHLLVERYYDETLKDDRAAREKFAGSETAFVGRMLEEDTKNYHVWSYRSYLVRKLGMWKMADERERRLVEAMIDEDVRNNSAWSHRFFLVFSDPGQSTPGKEATERDDAVPGGVVDREVAYALGKIGLAPQNQSAWNYLRGVLVKGGRRLGSVKESVEGYVKDLGGEEEEVRSTHALDLLAEIYAEDGEGDKADLALRRLGERWDPVRAGYWDWRRRQLGSGKGDGV